MRYPFILLMFDISIAASSQSCAYHSRYREAYFKKLPLNDFVATQEPLAEQSVRSDKDCGRKCVEYEGCVMFTFQSSQHDPSGHCRVYRQLPRSEVDQVDSPGARSYSLYDANVCASGYSLLCGCCLSFVKNKMSYNQAVQHCTQLNQGHLILTKTLEDLQCAACVMKMNNVTNGWVWVGGDDLQKEGDFVWNDGTLLPSNSSLWDDNQPNNNSPSEDCVSMLQGSQRLHDALCGSLTRYTICEKIIP